MAAMQRGPHDASELRVMTTDASEQQGAWLNNTDDTDEAA